MQRRRLLAITTGGLSAAGLAAYAQPSKTTAPALTYDAMSRGPVPIPPAERALQSVLAQPWFNVSDDGIILEGPAFDRSGNLFLCDASGGRVLRLTPQKQLSTVLTTELKPGGLAIDKDGRIFVAALDIPRGLGAVLIIQPDGSGMQTLIHPAAGYMPNDLVFDKEGGLYFSDFRGSLTDPQGGIYYVPHGTETVIPVVNHVAKANGVALSPDDGVLWFTEFGRNQLYRAELASAGVAMPLGTAIPYRFTGPAPDSMRADADGNVYVALHGQGRIVALNRTGIPIGQVLLPGRDDRRNLLCTNMALRPGTRDLLIVASSGPDGGGAGIFHVAAFADALRLYSHQ